MNEFFASFSVFGAFLTIFVYCSFVKLKERFQNAPINPLLYSIVFIIAFLLIFDVDYSTYNQSANYFTFFMTPATICLAIPLYQQAERIGENAVPVLTGILAGILANALTIYIFAIIFSLDHGIYITLLPKSITAAIGIVLSGEFGGYPDITIIAIIITGQAGNLMAPFICRAFRITDPVARGVGIGTASHAVGTAKAMEMGELTGAVSSFSMAVTGLATVLIAPAFIHFV